MLIKTHEKPPPVPPPRKKEGGGGGEGGRERKRGGGTPHLLLGLRRDKTSIDVVGLLQAVLRHSLLQAVRGRHRAAAGS